MSYKFSQLSNKKLYTCDPRIILLFSNVIKDIDCSIVCGHRGQEEQEKAYNSGASLARWGQSKHNTLPSLAVDVLPYPFNTNWNREQFEPLGKVVLQKANELDLNIRWGKYFKKIKDYPHWELAV